jgi:hypothetical protein
MDRPESSVVVPRTYWLQPFGSRVFPCVLAVFIFGSHWWPIIFGAKKASLSDFIFPSIYMLMCGVIALISFRSFVRLSEDSIKVSRVWRTKVLPFDRIKGRRRYTEKADPYSTPPRHLVLEPNDDRFPQLNIKEEREFDESFYRWFDSLPDLDKLDGLDAPQSKYSNFSLV